MSWLREELVRRIRHTTGRKNWKAGAPILGEEYEVVFAWENLLNYSSPLRAFELTDEALLLVWRCDLLQFEEMTSEGRRQVAIKRMEARAAKNDATVTACLNGTYYKGWSAMNVTKRKRVAAIAEKTKMPKTTVRDTLKRLQSKGIYTP